MVFIKSHWISFVQVLNVSTGSSSTKRAKGITRGLHLYLFQLFFSCANPILNVIDN